mmetsp:Transcript_112372/g.176856  ORF Transcript_112372/g.176856 Transcript_112372/m.176856 type:complete len:200 (+) Transcript_112372:427-1026(+)
MPRAIFSIASSSASFCSSVCSSSSGGGDSAAISFGFDAATLICILPSFLSSSTAFASNSSFAWISNRSCVSGFFDSLKTISMNASLSKPPLPSERTALVPLAFSIFFLKMSMAVLISSAVTPTLASSSFNTLLSFSNSFTEIYLLLSGISEPSSISIKLKRWWTCFSLIICLSCSLATLTIFATTPISMFKTVNAAINM